MSNLLSREASEITSKKPTQTLILRPEQRRELKNLLGRLLTGSPDETMLKLSQIVSEQKPPIIIAVGDMVSKNMAEHHIPVHIVIVDNKILREDIKPVQIETKTTLHVKNAPGTLTPEAWTTFQEALKKSQPVKVQVEGEEDLFTLVAVALAPDKSLVVYGQPNQGLVAVTVNKETRRKVQLILDAMQPAVEKAK
jgi:uncharacterized protein (UPF0218 family)